MLILTNQMYSNNSTTLFATIVNVHYTNINKRWTTVFVINIKRDYKMLCS